MQQFEQLQGAITGTQEQMRGLSFPPEMARGIEALETKMTAVAQAAAAVGDEAAAAFTKMDTAAAIKGIEEMIAHSFELEIEITPEMLEAARGLIFSFDPSCGYEEDYLRSIYLAMERVRRAAHCAN